MYKSTMAEKSAIHHSVENPRHYLPFHPAQTTFPKAGISVCANQKLKTNFGPVINNFGVNPLKKLVIPSSFIIRATIVNPLSFTSKFRFCILVFTTSNGALTSKLAAAPAILATKF